ncbi:MAG: sigma-70 family RNA polymerase sigma factor [Isosphaeraceae bacterium]
MAIGHRGSIIDSLGRLFDSGTVTGLGEAQLLDRFLNQGDEAAFEAILHRHGPMVLGVCRRVLDDPHDVADAFQTTFLILVKKARSIRDRDVLGTWLHGVARRVAVRAKVNARTRRTRERAGAEGLDVEQPRADRLDVNELRSLIDAELERLPTRYRQPVILCDLEGRTHEQAAMQIGCPVGTVKSRLSRGREQLRSRLARRGVAPSAALLATTLAAESAHAVPVELINLTLGAATRLAAGHAIAAGTFSAGVVTLLKGVLRSMFITKLKFAAVALAAVGLATTGVRAFIGHRAALPAPGEQAAAPIAAQAQTSSTPASPERGVERFQLDNGLKVILRPIQGARQTALTVVYSVGSDHDPEGRSGLAHWVEHFYVTASAGTAKARTAEEFARRYPDGANGQTGDRYTVIAAMFPKANLDEELRDAAARMSDLRITPADLDRERPRLLQEVGNMFGAFPSLAAMNHARELARPTPNGGRHGGSPDQLRAITVDDIRSFWKRYYKPRNAIVALAGDFDPAAARKMIAAQFAAIPAGDKAPTPHEPGKPKFGTVREVAVASPLPDAEATACIAYPAPQPGSDLYAPFLVLVSRLWAGAEKLGEGGVTGSPVYFTPLDDGSVVAVSAKVQPGEPAAGAIGRLEAFVAETIGPKLGDNEILATRNQLGLFLGLADVPDQFLAQNPYGVAFSLARREQLGLDPAKLNRELEALTEKDLRHAAAEVFAPARHAGAVISLEK